MPIDPGRRAAIKSAIADVEQSFSNLDVSEGSLETATTAVASAVAAQDKAKSDDAAATADFNTKLAALNAATAAPRPDAPPRRATRANHMSIARVSRVLPTSRAAFGLRKQPPYSTPFTGRKLFHED
jgi:hypothetical protein